MTAPNKLAAVGFDLTEAFQSCPINDPIYGSIVQALRALESVVSIHKDLAEAKAAIDAGATLEITDGLTARSPAEFVKLEALFVHVIMLYCKAVHSSTKARTKFDVLERYSAEQREAHLAVVNLRDRVIAHFGQGRDEVSGPWIEDHIVLWRDGGKYSYSYPSKRAASKGSVARSLYELIPVAIARIEEYGSARQDKLMTLLKEGMDRNPRLRELIERHPFDEVTFFGAPTPVGSSVHSVVEAVQRPKDR